MTITIAEAYDSRPLQLGTSPTSTRRYEISGSSDEAACAAALLAEAPASVSGLPLLNHAVEPIHVDTDNEGQCRWLGIAYYGLSQNVRAETGESRFSFSTMGGTRHITQSIATVASYNAPGQPTQPDFKGAINVGQDGTVNGTDIVSPTYAWTVTKYVDADDVDQDYVDAIADLTGQVNDDTFDGKPAGEVLLLGAEGSARGDEDWEITFSFARSPNLTGLTIGTITGVDKKGWECLWVLYAPMLVDGETVSRPRAAYVEQVYYEGDFSALGLS